MGSIRAARHAGMALAMTVTIRTSSTTPAKARGSVAVTPNNIPDKNRVSRKAAPTPAATPIIVIRRL